jgi:hypothetical protein
MNEASDAAVFRIRHALPVLDPAVDRRNGVVVQPGSSASDAKRSKSVL